MTETLPKKNLGVILAQEENFLDWNVVVKKFEITFGNDIYESWIKNINLKKEFNHYIVLSAPTRFVRDWIVSRYADKILDIIKTFKISKILSTYRETTQSLINLVGVDKIT